ncbi:Sodium- and chloride-dependent glycine transporter 2 [Armadillidium vulgare]|nr:Sodium- and chloride-dependent glycine transporter 2 [Armadillidium vulgare]
MLVFCGLPLMFFELCLGQFGREGPITVWKISPLFQGIGYAMFMISFYIGCYYNVVLSWAIYYIYSSLTHTLPWTSCEGDWNTEFCKKYSSRNCSIAGGLLNQTGHCIYSHMISEEEWTRLNESVTSLKSPSYEYFHGHVLDITDGLHEMGDFQFHIIISLFVAWIIVYLVLMKGVETFGKSRFIHVLGAGLAFVAYPEAVARLPLSPVWSVLFFAMLLTLGLGTQFTILTTITTTITDDFPVTSRKELQVGSSPLLCIDVWCRTLNDDTRWYVRSADDGLILLNLLCSHGWSYRSKNVIVVTWVYGVDNFLDDIKIMLGFDPYPRRLWKYVWKFGMPGIVMVILVFSLVEFRSASYEDYEFPLWANIVGWVLSFSSVLLIPIVAIIKICQESGTLLERIRKLSRAQSDWAPPNEARLRPNESFGAKPLLKVTSFGK